MARTDRAPARARIAASVAFATHGGMFGTWATQIPLVKERLGLDPGTLGLALLCLAAGGVAAMQGAGRLTARLGGIRLLRLSAVVSCLAVPAASLAPSALGLALILLVMGMGLGTLDLVMNAQAVEVERRIGRPVMSGLHGMWSAGTLTGSLLGAALLWVLPGAVEASVVAAGALAATLATTRMMLPMEPAPEGLDTKRIGVFRQPVLLVIGAAMALAFAVEGALLDWSAIFLREVRHMPAAAGLGYAAFSGCTLVGRLLGDRCRARWGDLALLHGAFLSAAGMVLAVVVQNGILTIACFALTGLALCNIAPILFNAAGRLGADHGPTGSARTIGSTVSFAYAGVAAAPPLFGFVARHSSLGVALCCAAGLAFVLGAMTLRPGWLRP